MKKYFFRRLMHKLFDRPCCECGEVEVLFWERRCSFCDVGEGKMVDCAYFHVEYGYFKDGKFIETKEEV
jgi:hypothetical protein